MNLPSSTSIPPAGELLPAPASAAEIDASCRLPVLHFFGASSFWLVMGSLLAVIASIKMHSAGFLADCPYFTYGRVRAASSNILLYGFAIQAGLALSLWLTARLARTPLAGAGWSVVAGKFWNIGVALGALGIFLGDNTGYEWFEFPRYATPILFAAYAVAAIQGLLTFQNRRERQMAVSQWYLFAAWFWFPWIYSTAQLLLLFFPVRGAMQAVVSGWYAHNLFKVWLASVALAGIYYFIPKLTQRPLQNRGLAVFGFWTFILFAPWGGGASLQAAPNWISSLGAVMSGFLLVATLAIATHLWQSLAGSAGTLRSRPGGSHFFFAIAAFVAVNALGALGQIQPIADVTRFTLYFQGTRFLELTGFAGVALIAAFCLIVPALGAGKSPVGGLAKIAFLAFAGGAALIGGGLVLGGLLQGSALSNPATPFIDTVRKTVPFLGLATLGWLVIFLGSVALFFGFARQIAADLRSCCACSGSVPAKNIAGARV